MNEEKAKTLTDVLLSIKQVCDDLLAIIAKTQVKPSGSQAKLESVEDLQRLILQDLQNLLAFEETADAFVIKPRAFLGSDNFVKIASIIRSLGGEYVSAGKDSHFEIQRRT